MWLLGTGRFIGTTVACPSAESLDDGFFVWLLLHTHIQRTPISDQKLRSPAFFSSLILSLPFLVFLFRPTVLVLSLSLSCLTKERKKKHLEASETENVQNLLKHKVGRWLSMCWWAAPFSSLTTTITGIILSLSLLQWT